MPAALVLFAAVTEVSAAPTRQTRLGEELSLVFLAGDSTAVHRDGYDSAVIDVGRVVAGNCPSRGCTRTVVKKRFRLRVDGRASATRFVRVRAFVQVDIPGQRIRIDGRLVTSLPQQVGAATPLGVPVSHLLEIEVPASEPAGSITQDIVWLVEDVR